MPTTLFTLPRELRDEIFTYVACSSGFTFLLTCRQIYEEGIPLLYKYGFYRIQALVRRRRDLPVPPTPALISVIQNLYISMPPIRFGGDEVFWNQDYEMSHRTVQLFSQFSGTETRRRVCHFDFQAWALHPGMVKKMTNIIIGFRGFDIVRVEVRLRPSGVEHDVRGNPFDFDREDKQRDECMQLIEERLGTALGEAEWSKVSGDRVEQVLVAEFRPRGKGNKWI